MKPSLQPEVVFGKRPRSLTVARRLGQEVLGTFDAGFGGKMLHSIKRDEERAHRGRFNWDQNHFIKSLGGHISKSERGIAASAETDGTSVEAQIFKALKEETWEHRSAIERVLITIRNKNGVTTMLDVEHGHVMGVDPETGKHYRPEWRDSDKDMRDVASTAFGILLEADSKDELKVEKLEDLELSHRHVA